MLSVQGSLAKGSEDEQAGREKVTEFIVTSGGRQGCGRHLCKVGGVKEQAPWTTASQRHRKWAQNTHGGGGGGLATLGRSLQPGRFICLFFQNKTKNHHSKYLRRVLSSITVKSFM